MLMEAVLLLFLLIFFTGATENSRDFSLCNRRLPGYGRWVDNPPYWYPKNCPETRMFDQSATIECMKGRTLYVIGNSIARQQAFALLEMLGGAYVTREGQRDLCPKHETFWGDSCHTELHDVKFKYLFLQFLDGYNYTSRGGFPFYSPEDYRSPGIPNTPGEVIKMYWEDDNCINMNTRACLRRFFANSTSRDVLIFAAGMPYCGLGSQVANPPLNQAWLRNSASAFRAHIASTFPGTVFRLNNAHVGHRYSQFQGCIDTVNEMLDELWNFGSEENPWYVIDQRQINMDRSHYYNDDLHFVGPLTTASLMQALNVLCPQFGFIDRSHAINFIGATIASRLNYTSRYAVDPMGTLHRIPVTCFPAFYSKETSVIDNTTVSTNKRIILPDAIINKYEKSTPVPAYLCEIHSLIQLINDRAVYVLLDDFKYHMFNSANAFLSRGYEFEKVQHIDRWLFDYFWFGDPLD